MKIEKKANALLIVPETEFEEKTLTQMFGLGKTFGAYIKCGMTTAEVIGLKITTDEIKVQSSGI